MNALNSTIENKDLLLSTTARTPDVSVAAVRMSTLLAKRKDKKKKKTLKSNDQKQEIPSSKSSSSNALTSQTCTTLVGSVRVVNSRVDDGAHESSTNVNKKDYPVKKLSDEIDTESINYRIEMDFKETVSVVTNQDYESRSGDAINDTLFDETFVQALQRDDPTCSNVQSRPVSRNDSTAFAVAKRALELQQKKPLTKISQIIFPPLRAPQSIVNVRHPSITDAKMTKHEETIGPISESTRELEREKKTSNNQDTSQISGISNVRDPCDVALSQLTQSPSFSTTQIDQSNQHQNYDPDDSFADSPVNDNPMIPRFSGENSVPCTLYENPSEFVQTDRYSATDRPNDQYQCQSTGVGKIQNATMFIRNLKSLRSPITVAERQAANSTKTAKAESTSRSKMPSKSNN